LAPTHPHGTKQRYSQTMSSECVEVVRHFVDAFNRADIESCLAVVDAENETDVSRAAGPYAGVYRGPDAVRKLLEGYFEAWEFLVWKPEHFLEPENGRVVMPFQASARGIGSGVEVEARAVVVFRVRERKILKMTLFNSEEEAAGASEQDAHIGSS
jgi:ketosteroid isomerase-like protein